MRQRHRHATSTSRRSKGSIGIDVEGYDGPIKVRAWIGTRIPSDESSIRDATGFIEFGDFREQTEFGKVAKEINKKVVAGSRASTRRTSLGKTVDFTGAITMRTVQPAHASTSASWSSCPSRSSSDDRGDHRPTRPPMSLRVPMRAEHITKVFPGTTALDDVTFDVFEGQVNVLVGENGAGKSTLMKVLAGVEQPTDGRILMDGEPVVLPSVTDAAEQGVGIIFQELNLCTNLTVLDNLFLAQEITRGRAIDRGAQKKLARGAAGAPRPGHRPR